MKGEKQFKIPESLRHEFILSVVSSLSENFLLLLHRYEKSAAKQFLPYGQLGKYLSSNNQ